MPELGDSISVNGCCLTVAGMQGRIARFDVVHETLRRTTLGGLAAGARVNLEHAVTVQTLLGGHIVQGHVDGLGSVIRIAAADDHRIRIEAPADLQVAIVVKGSITVEGVSLTVAACEADWFEVALIPETLRRTTLGALTTNQRVNLEADYIARIVVSWLEQRSVR